MVLKIYIYLCSKVILAAFLIIVSSTVASQNRAYADNLKTAQNAGDSAKAEAQLEQLRKEISEIGNALQDQRSEQTKQQKKLEKIDQKLSDIGKQVFELRLQDKALNEQFGALQQQQAELKIAVAAKQAGIGERLKLLYQLQGQSQLSQILSQRNPADSQRSIVALKTINEKTAQELEQLNQLQEQQQLNAKQLDENRNDAAKVLSSLDRKQRDLEEQRDKRLVALDALSEKLQRDEAAHSLKLQNKAQLEVLIEKLAKNSAIKQLAERQRNTQQRAKPKGTIGSGTTNGPLGFFDAKGKMSWPAAGKKNLVFGQRKDGSGRRWQGITIVGDAGSTVRTIHSGTIIFADYLAAQGLLIIVDHGAGYWSLYGRNESLLRQVGDPVEAGEAIATIGASGGHKHSALYFEIRQSGDPQNPSHWCSNKA